MLVIEKNFFDKSLSVYGMIEAIYGMRNPMNSWEKMDSYYDSDLKQYIIGENDKKLMNSLIRSGSDHRKFLRMITVYLNITAPLYWWKEFDTYKIGTVANSCSTMHKIHSEKLSMEDFSIEYLNPVDLHVLSEFLNLINHYIESYNKTKSKDDWYKIIQLLPSSYNQKRTVALNFEVLFNMYHARKNHKLDEWVYFCEFINAIFDSYGLVL